MRVSVYFNLHRKLYSVRAEEGPLRGRVVAHATDVLIDEPTFLVSEAGRARVLRERKKYVHAYVRGNIRGMTGSVLYPNLPPLFDVPLFSAETLVTRRRGRPFSYNPYRSGSFEYYTDIGDLRPCMSAERAFLSLTDGNLALYPSED